MALKTPSRPIRTETGAQLLGRLEARPTLTSLEVKIFPELKPGSVIEISGDSNTGKSELLYHFITKCILPPEWKGVSLNGLNSQVLFVSAGGHFDIFRLINIMEQRINKMCQQVDHLRLVQDDVAEFIPSCLHQLHVITCTDTENLIVTLHHCKYMICANIKISCLMIDSISAFYWGDRGRFAPQYKNLNELYMKLVGVLKQIIADYSITIIAVKQNLTKSHVGYSGTVYDFMGLAWQKFITEQIQMAYNKSENNKTFLQLKHVSGNEENIKMICVTDAGLEIL